MIYLDYAADTPADQEVLQTFLDTSKEFIGNPNSPHRLGALSKARINDATQKIAGLLHVKETEIIYTSGASESNNLAIKGIAEKYRKYGKHIITTYLEHSSVNGAMAYLQSHDYEIEYVGITPNGLVDLTQLKELLRQDTILVSVCYVDSEIGICQQVSKIAEIVSGYPHCFFHTDATQAVGKIPVSFEGIDLATFAPHKFFGVNGCGVLIKKECVMLEPQIHGGISTTPFRSGTPALALIAAAEKALSLAVSNQEDRVTYVRKLNKHLREVLSTYSRVRINSTDHSIPHILNISVPGVKAEEIWRDLEKHDIYVSTKSACCAPNTVSRPVYALTKDRKAALSTLRISLSHLTSKEDIAEFLKRFDECCKNMENRRTSHAGLPAG